jgi:hypothetical protein
MIENPLENKNALKSAEARRKECVLNGEGGPQEAAHTITIDDSSLDAHDLKLAYQLGYDAGDRIGFAPGGCRPGSATRALQPQKGSAAHPGPPPDSAPKGGSSRVFPHRLHWT